MNIEECKNLFIQERLGEYYKKHNNSPQKDPLEMFKEILSNSSSTLVESYNKHLDYYAEQIGQEKEELYCFGICDGIRLAQAIANLLKE